MSTTQTGTLLILMMITTGCGRQETTSVTRTDDSTPSVEPQSGDSVIAGTDDEQSDFTTVPVQSSDLTGVWYGATRETGVVIQFIGRQSQEPDEQGVVSGQWVVHVTGGSIGSAIEFVDNVQSGSVDLEVGLVSNETKKALTARLGCIERSDDGGLHLSIYENDASELYVPASRIRLRRAKGEEEIGPDTIDKMRTAHRQMQAT